MAISDDVDLFQTLIVAIVAIVCGLITSVFITIFRVLSRKTGGQLQQEIAQHIQDGAQAFLKREYMFLAVFVLVMTVVVGFAMGKT